MALCLGGCGSQGAEVEVAEPSEPVVSPLEIEAGFGNSEWGTSVGVVVKNPNADLAYRSVALVITLKDADGNVVAADPEFKIGDVLPGEEVGLGILMGDGNAATVKVSTSDGGTFEAEPLTTLKVENYNINDYANVLGEVTNNGESKVNDLLLGVVLRNSAGEIIGGGFDDLMNVAAGATVPFEIYTFDESGNIADADVYAHIYY